jgi:Icc-related predicted phosphoesterase
MTRVFFATDIHGSERVFRKLLKFVNSPLRPNVIVIGGDISGKTLVPIIRNGDTWQVSIYPERKMTRSDSEVLALFNWVGNHGGYAIISTPHEWRDLSEDQSQIDEILKIERMKRLRQWVKAAHECMSLTGCRIYVNTGNDDPLYLDEVLAEEGLGGPIENRVVNLSSHVEMISCGYTNKTPWDCPRDVDEDVLESLLEESIRRAKSPETAIFNFHCPPINSGLDEAILLDHKLTPKLGFSGVVTGAVGSRAVRNAIEKWQPLMSLHGHIHEIFRATALGRTVCCNPGSDYQNGLLRGVFFTVGSGELIDWSLFREDA